MTDRELLEAAAKAAGLKVHARHQAGRDACGAGDVGLWISNETTCWNPLLDDGDAFRLAVRLRIDVVFEKQHTVAAYTDRDEWFCEHCEDGMGADIEVKTRRAIVRAAAAMGGAG